MISEVITQKHENCAKIKFTVLTNPISLILQFSPQIYKVDVNMPNKLRVCVWRRGDDFRLLLHWHFRISRKEGRRGEHTADKMLLGE